jgi:alcohol dehydrogenase class IV
MSPNIYLGSNSIEELAHLYPNKKYHIWHIPELDPRILRLIKACLGHRVISQHIYDFGMPDIEVIQSIHHSFSKITHASDSVILAIGGGSLMDFAKVIRFKSSMDNWWVDQLNAPLNSLADGLVRLPLILIPTTAGTGSEVTGTATIWDFRMGTKNSFYGSQVYADCAIVDHQLTHNAPWNLTRDSGLDALSHALESIWNVNASDETRSLAIRASQKICQYLPRLKESLNDEKAREEMMEASLMAGMAMSKTQTALAHALSYDDTISTGVSHGYACATWLPAVWSLLEEKEEYSAINAQILEAIGAHMLNAQEMCQWLRNLGIQSHDPDALTVDHMDLMRQALNSSRGRNFIGSIHRYEAI